MRCDSVTKHAIAQILHYYLIIGHTTFPHGIESMFVIFDCDIESNKSKIVNCYQHQRTYSIQPYIIMIPSGVWIVCCSPEYSGYIAYSETNIPRTEICINFNFIFYQSSISDLHG